MECIQYGVWNVECGVWSVSVSVECGWERTGQTAAHLPRDLGFHRDIPHIPLPGWFLHHSISDLHILDTDTFAHPTQTQTHTHTSSNQQARGQGQGQGKEAG